MPPDSYQYAVLRAVPSLPRGECINVGVVLFCRRASYLAVRWELDESRLRSFAPELDLAALAAHLSGLERVAAGDPEAGAVARLEQSERFHWLVAPSSTIIQASEVHTGLVADAPPEDTLARLFSELVAA